MFCKSCGTKMADGANFCPACGFKTEINRNPKVVVADGLNHLVPNNKMALWGYYIGLFSLIGIILPLGFLLGGGAVWCALKGIRYAKIVSGNPGYNHAMVGLIVGGMSVALSLLVHLIKIVSMLNRAD